MKQMRFIPMILAMVLLTIQDSQAQNWSHFRGDNLDGVAINSNLPTHWDNDSNVVWKVPVHDKGWSSPVIFEDQVWLTTATRDGKKMYALCLDFETGELIHDILLFEPDSVYRIHGLNSYATPTPCIEEGRVYVSFGKYGISCMDTESGEIVWKRDDLKCVHVQGPASSPVIYKDYIITHIEGDDVQYLVALDKKNGKTIWRADRPREIYEPLLPLLRISYVTAKIVNVNGKDQLISNGSAVCNSYNPLTGSELWRIVKGYNATIAMPVEEGGIIYYYAGFEETSEGKEYSELLAVDPDAQGDITDSDNILWSIESPKLQMLTPIVKDGLLYTIDTRNFLRCIDAKTGDIIWSERLKEKYNASPVWANGHIYFPSIKGNTLMIEEGRKYNPVATNKVEGQIWASPAVSGNALLLRSDKYLYKIGHDFKRADKLREHHEEGTGKIPRPDK